VASIRLLTGRTGRAVPRRLNISFLRLIATDHKSSLHRIDLRNWRAGDPIQPQQVLVFPDEARALNGSCLISPRTILVADSGAGLIWRVVLPKDGGTPVARVWLRHESMGNRASADRIWAQGTQKFEHKRAAMEAGNALIEPRSGDSPQPRVERSGRYAPPWA